MQKHANITRQGRQPLKKSHIMLNPKIKDQTPEA